MLADAANAGSSNVAVLLPLKGVSQLDRPGGPFWDPAADGACYDAIRSRLGRQIEISEVDYNVNDPEFADLVTDRLLAMIRHAGNSADV